MPSQDLTTKGGLAVYLEAHNTEYKDIALLTGGTANYVYRVTLATGRTIIYKHAAPYLHSNHNFAFDPIRMDYEDRVLEILPPLLAQRIPNSTVHPVTWYSYDKEAKLLCISDGGDGNLKAAFKDPSLNIPQVASELGRWLAALHLSSTNTPLSRSNSHDLKSNNPVGVAIYRHAYANLSQALSTYGHDPGFGKYINKEFGSKLAIDNECICHGDFWPGNVLVKFKVPDGKDVELTIVDWEMTRRGTSATDVAQFAAEAFLLDRFHDEKGLLITFLKTYVAAREEAGSNLNREWLRRVAVHWGTHVAFWPTRVEWTDKAGTQKLVDIGVKLLKAVVDEDWDALKSSELFRDMGAGLDRIIARP
jgi:Ser/Thr protein kinase RdoA (MazF antagonist)